jgi:hypothetical protein
MADKNVLFGQEETWQSLYEALVFVGYQKKILRGYAHKDINIVIGQIDYCGEIQSRAITFTASSKGPTRAMVAKKKAKNQQTSNHRSNQVQPNNMLARSHRR